MVTKGVSFFLGLKMTRFGVREEWQLKEGQKKEVGSFFFFVTFVASTWSC